MVDNIKSIKKEINLDVAVRRRKENGMIAAVLEEKNVGTYDSSGLLQQN